MKDLTGKELAIIIIALDIAMSEIERKSPSSTKEVELLKTLQKRMIHLHVAGGNVR